MSLMLGAGQLAAVTLALAAAGGGALGGPPPAEVPAEPRLPDLRQDVPRDLGIASDRSRAEPRFRLGFRSAAENVGTGPLVVRGRRTGAGAMTARQVVRNADGSTTVRRGVGPIRYVTETDHRHWHLVGFERYELRRAADLSLVRPDRKTGFCLGDRYDADVSARRPFEPPEPVFTHRCGLDRPNLRSLTQGISVGYGDDYPAQIEGQFIDVTGLDAGRYVLVHRVNADRRLLESRYANNASSTLIDLRWPPGPRGRPQVATLERCPGRAQCG